MPAKLVWPQPRRGEFASPFDRGAEERPLRITLHTAGLVNLSENERTALEVLMDHAHPPLVEILNSEGLPLGVDDAFAASSNQTTATRHQDILVAQAHCQAQQDILVTASPYLIAHSQHPTIHQSNPLLPSDAAVLLGLFLRSRDRRDVSYVYRVSSSRRIKYNRSLFYRSVISYRMPALWRYVAACRAAGPASPDDTPALGESVEDRIVRALQACDAIGAQVYSTQSNDTRDVILYHFGYMTLLLSGALDVEARVAYRAYVNPAIGVKPLNERILNFRYNDFQTWLAGARAQDLVHLVQDKRFQNVTLLLSRLRNTIHGAALEGVAYHDHRVVPDAPPASLITVPSKDAADMWAAASAQGPVARWGLQRLGADIMLAPYDFAVTIVHEVMALVNEIAAATDTTRLLTGQSPAQLPNAPSANSFFNPEWTRRLDPLVS